MASPPDCILILQSGHPLNEQAVEAAKARMDVSGVMESDNWDAWKDDIQNMKGVFVFNFLSNRILRGPILSRDAVNFHPAPPEYPGVGTASYALFDDVPSYGATAHRMNDRPDTGDILLVERFPISAEVTCQKLSERAEQSCLDLFIRILSHVETHGAFPEPCGEKWSREPFTRRDLKEWLVLDPDDPESFERKIRAAHHPHFPGPYVMVNGHKFSLDED